MIVMVIVMMMMTTTISIRELTVAGSVLVPGRWHVEVAYFLFFFVMMLENIHISKCFASLCCTGPHTYVRTYVCAWLHVAFYLSSLFLLVIFLFSVSWVGVFFFFNISRVVSEKVHKRTLFLLLSTCHCHHV